MAMHGRQNGNGFRGRPGPRNFESKPPFCRQNSVPQTSGSSPKTNQVQQGAGDRDPAVWLLSLGLQRAWTSQDSSGLYYAVAKALGHSDQRETRLKLEKHVNSHTESIPKEMKGSREVLLHRISDVKAQPQEEEMNVMEQAFQLTFLVYKNMSQGPLRLNGSKGVLKDVVVRLYLNGDGFYDTMEQTTANNKDCAAKENASDKESDDVPSNKNEEENTPEEVVDKNSDNSSGNTLAISPTSSNGGVTSAPVEGKTNSVETATATNARPPYNPNSVTAQAAINTGGRDRGYRYSHPSNNSIRPGREQSYNNLGYQHRGRGNLRGRGSAGPRYQPRSSHHSAFPIPRFQLLQNIPQYSNQGYQHRQPRPMANGDVYNHQQHSQQGLLPPQSLPVSVNYHWNQRDGTHILLPNFSQPPPNIRHATPPNKVLPTDDRNVTSNGSSQTPQSSVSSRPTSASANDGINGSYGVHDSSGNVSSTTDPSNSVPQSPNLAMQNSHQQALMPHYVPQQNMYAANYSYVTPQQLTPEQMAQMQYLYNSQAMAYDMQNWNGSQPTTYTVTPTDPRQTGYETDSTDVNTLAQTMQHQLVLSNGTAPNPYMNPTGPMYFLGPTPTQPMYNHSGILDMQSMNTPRPGMAPRHQQQREQQPTYSHAYQLEGIPLQMHPPVPMRPGQFYPYVPQGYPEHMGYVYQQPSVMTQDQYRAQCYGYTHENKNKQ